MRILYMLMLFPLFLPMRNSADPLDSIALLIKNSDSEGLCKLFDQSVRLTILGDENVYFKGQAQVVLEKFLKTHVPLSTQILHRVETSPDVRFAVYAVKTDKNNFRFSVQMRADQGTYVITEIRIENSRD